MGQRPGVLPSALYGQAVLWAAAVETCRKREDTPEVQAVWEEFTRYRDMDHLGPENPG